MTQDLIVMVMSITMGLLAYTLIALWYVMPRLATRPRQEALTLLLLGESVHAGREPSRGGSAV